MLTRIRLLFLGGFFGGFFSFRWLFDLDGYGYHFILNCYLGSLFDLSAGYLYIFIKCNFMFFILTLQHGDMVPVKFQNRAGNLIALGRAGQSKRSDQDDNSRHQNDPFHRNPPLKLKFNFNHRISKKKEKDKTRGSRELKLG